MSNSSFEKVFSCAAAALSLQLGRLLSATTAFAKRQIKNLQTMPESINTVVFRSSIVIEFWSNEIVATQFFLSEKYFFVFK